MDDNAAGNFGSVNWHIKKKEMELKFDSSPEIIEAIDVVHGCDGVEGSRDVLSKTAEHLTFFRHTFLTGGKVVEIANCLIDYCYFSQNFGVTK